MDVTIIADNGHAWGIVSVEQLKAARLSIDDISDFSYKTPNGEVVLCASRNIPASHRSFTVWFDRSNEPRY